MSFYNREAEATLKGCPTAFSFERSTSNFVSGRWGSVTLDTHPDFVETQRLLFLVASLDVFEGERAYERLPMVEHRMSCLQQSSKPFGISMPWDDSTGQFAAEIG